MNLLENYGLAFLAEDEKTFKGFETYIASNGKAIKSYSGTPYLYKNMGSVEFFEATGKNAENGRTVVTSFHTHCCGDNVIELTPSGTPQILGYIYPWERLLLFRRCDGEDGLFPIDVITADVLPSFLEGDRIKLQLVAQPLVINYYADEAAYEAAQPGDERGEKQLVADGTLLPMRLLVGKNILNHHMYYEFDGETDDETDDDAYDAELDEDMFVLFRATVTDIYPGIFEMGDKRKRFFIRSFAKTQLGRLEFDHIYEQVPESQRCNIKVGSVISGVCIISGDAIIDEYANGPIIDFEHNLRLIRHTLVKGQEQRLISVLSEKAVYESEADGDSCVGVKNIIDRLYSVRLGARNSRFAHFAALTETFSAEFPKGTSCVVRAVGREDNYDIAVLLNCGEDGRITKIKVCKAQNIRFAVKHTEQRKPQPENCGSAEQRSGAAE